MKKKTNKTFYNCLLNHLMRQGKKSSAYLDLKNLGFELSNYNNMAVSEIYDIIFNNIRPYIELKKIRVRRTTYIVPFPTNLTRQQHLASQWLLETIRKDKRKMSTKIKLNAELIRILFGKGETVEKKKNMYKKAEKSRSFMHYRWY